MNAVLSHCESFQTTEQFLRNRSRFHVVVDDENTQDKNPSKVTHEYKEEQKMIEAFAKKAALKFLAIYTYHLEQGSITPNENDVTLITTKGVEENFFEFRYMAIDGLQLAVAVVVGYDFEKHKPTIEVRVLKRAFKGILSPVKSKWLSLSTTDLL